ncbi:MAG: (2Fe-2S)-binding protein [Ardenticatenaceae bacterium]|nr:(2Fe-2S)-binding protein [Ardenticatenaceae bacterium]HBY94365.1 (2Fe-2S)-binding protein [Chloroflexota bacterium]
MRIPITLNANGETHELYVEPRWTLLDVLRNELELRGAHRGCDSGDCGACTVLLAGEPVPACLVLAVDADGSEVVTVEGVASGTGLHPVQTSFVRRGAVQCGYCTPGMVISAVALLRDNPRPTEPEIRAAIAGNLCRCTGYSKIVEAILEASRV